MANLKLAGTTNKATTIIHSAIDDATGTALSVPQAGAWESLYTGTAGVDTIVISDDGFSVKIEVTQPIEVV